MSDDQWHRVAMHNSSKSHKNASTSIGGSHKLKIITNGNGTSTVVTTATTVSNGKNRNRLSKNVLPAASTLDLFAHVSVVHSFIFVIRTHCQKRVSCASDFDLNILCLFLLFLVRFG